MDLKNIEFRDLHADEIELRVGTTKRKEPSKPKSETNPVVGFQLLLYKTARVDANILDETFGPFNWAKKYYQVKNTMFCSIGIKNPETGDWVWKDDAGDDDFQTEQVKGEASDSFKRAGFAWGIGRLNLYYGPFIWIKCDSDINEFSKLYVDMVEYKNHIISKIVIKERSTDKLVYTYPKNLNVAQTSEKAVEKPKDNLSDNLGTIRPADLARLEAYTVSCTPEQLDKLKNWSKRHYGTDLFGALTERQGRELCKTLNI